MNKVVVKPWARVDGTCIENGISVLFNDKEIGKYSCIDESVLSDVLEEIGIELDIQRGS